jgi:hypothetical protein
MSLEKTYNGRSGQMVVLAELLIRQCNGAIPEVDVGTDVFAFQDAREEVARVQVKTAWGKPYKKEEGYSVRFEVPMQQLKRRDRPPLYYVFAVRLADRWGDFRVLSRPELKEFWNGDRPFGTENGTTGNLVFTAQFRPGNVTCGDVDLTAFRNAWDRLPPLRPVPAVVEEPRESGQP